MLACNDNACHPGMAATGVGTFCPSRVRSHTLRSSQLIDTPSARIASMMGCRHRAGTPLRCHHFLVACSETPRRPATAATLERRSRVMLISRDELSPVSMVVPGDELSQVQRTTWGLTVVRSGGQWGMTASSLTEWNLKFCRRIAELRDARGWTQQQMADALGINLERYKKYETRTPMPHGFVSRFALIVGREIEDLYAVDRPVKRPRTKAKAS